MRVAIPHDLDKEEVRRRMRAQSHEIGNYMPGGFAQIETGWPNDDCMTLGVQAMGQNVDGRVLIEEGQLVFEVNLPPALSFFEGVVDSAIRKQAPKLLTKD